VISGQETGDRIQKKQPVTVKKSLIGLSWFEYALEAGNDRQTRRKFFASVFSELRGKSRLHALTGSGPDHCHWESFDIHTHPAECVAQI
jgi:hypothetical protein